jgi:hypothetical protein
VKFVNRTGLSLLAAPSKFLCPVHNWEIFRGRHACNARPRQRTWQATRICTPHHRCEKFARKATSDCWLVVRAEVVRGHTNQAKFYCQVDTLHRGEGGEVNVYCQVVSVHSSVPRNRKLYYLIQTSPVKPVTNVSSTFDRIREGTG